MKNSHRALNCQRALSLFAQDIDEFLAQEIDTSHTHGASNYLQISAG